MAQVVETSKKQEYWRSPHPEIMRLVSPLPSSPQCCPCGADYSPGAHFCHICGSEREKRLTLASQGEASTRSVASTDILDELGLTLASVIFFLLGIGCIAAAILTGFIFKADTLVDWQAIQLWRIEWLLGASAALLAGILLKRHS